MAKIACPKCGNKIDLVDHPRKPGRVAGYCACGGSKPRAMIECDAPEPAKETPPKTRKTEKESADSGQPRTVEPDPA